MGDRGTGRSRLDPILARSLALAGFGLGLLALGRALKLLAQGGARDAHSGQSDVVANHMPSQGIPCAADGLPPN